MMAAALAVAAILWGWPPASAAGDLRLTADAGLGGISRPGRWTPVRVAIENAAGDVEGELVIEWGNTRLHRELTLVAPSRSNLELYVRTQDVRAAITVSVVSHETTVATVDTPIRMNGDAPLVVCVA